MDIRARAHEISDEMLSWRRDFHAHPELSNNEFRTTEKIVELLKSFGCDSVERPLPTGAVAIIKNVMSKFVVDGIKYHKLGNDEIWAQELFESEELSGYLNSNMVETPNHGIYEYTVYDSDIEREFAERLDANEDVKVFAKLPDWFKIPTPLGTYNPDWAILVEKDGCNRLYFVVETKGTDLFGQLPPPQQAKNRCGEAHFAALGKDMVTFHAPVASYDRFDDLVNREIQNSHK